MSAVPEGVECPCCGARVPNILALDKHLTVEHPRGADSSALPQPPQVTDAMVEADPDVEWLREQMGIHRSWALHNPGYAHAQFESNLAYRFQRIASRLAALGAPEPAERRRFERGTGPHGLVTSRDMDPINLRAPSSPPASQPLCTHVSIKLIGGRRQIRCAYGCTTWLDEPEPPPPATPSEKAIRAAERGMRNAEGAADSGWRDALRAAYAVDFGAQSPPPPATPSEETAWLIEHHDLGVVSWWTGRGPHEWTCHHEQAIRYARKQDAETALQWVRDQGVSMHLQASEHMWLPREAAQSRPEAKHQEGR